MSDLSRARRHRLILLGLSALLVFSESVGFASNGAVSYSYDALGRLTQVVYPNGVAIVYGLDSAGNRTEVTSVQPPSAPGTPTITSIAGSTATASWTAPSTGTAPINYEYSLDGGSSWTSVGTTQSASLSGLTGNGAGYTFAVRAYDAAGVRGPQSSTSFDTAPSAPGAVSISNIGGTTATAAWGSATDSAGVAGYEYMLNGDTSWTPVGSALSANLSALAPCATHTFSVRAYDSAGTRGGSSSASFSTTDASSPTAPTGFTATPVSQTQIDLSWTASSDVGGCGLSGYRVYRDGSEISTTSNTFYADAGLAGYTAYTYTVVAYDAQGKTSASSASASAKTLDTTAPTTPTGLGASAVSQSQINLSWSGSTDSGGSGLAGYRIYRNGTQIGTSTATSYSDTGLSGYTTYTYTVAAYDNAGNVSTQSTSATAKTPDQTPPSVPTGLTATSVTATSVTLSWNASTDSGGSGMGGYAIYNDGSEYTGVAAPTTSIAVNTNSGSTYNFSIAAYDYVGNRSAQSASIQVVTPPGVPSTPGQPGPSGILKTKTWTEGWNASTGPVSYYVLSVNNGTTTANHTVTAPTTTYAMTGANGISYTMSVTACNSSGQCSAPSPESVLTICLRTCL